MTVTFPEIPIKRIAVKLKPNAEKRIKQGHPWVFSDAIAKQSKAANTGDLVVLFGNRNDKPYALGLFDEASPIRIKIISHVTTQINNDFFLERAIQAKKHRSELLQTGTNSYRLIFGENDQLPSLIADVYANVLVVKIYSGIWWPYLQILVKVLLKVSEADTAVLRFSRAVEKAHTFEFKNGQIIYGQLANEVVHFKEHGLQFSANVIYGHKTGYFLDHRANRKRVGELAKGKTVLDVFSYAGGFSVHALSRGAKAVTSVDISAKALEVASYNVGLNHHTGKHLTICGDAFEVLENLKAKNKSFDIVVIDPPSFAKSVNAISIALKQYERLATLGAHLVTKNGWLVLASCSSRVSEEDFHTSSALGIKRSGRIFQLKETTAHDIDHPVTFKEGRYLKCGYWKFA